jgi:hypothetical protein
MEPTRLRFLVSGPGTYYIDAARELSKANRKLVRQFQDFTVMGGLIKDSNNDSVVRMNVAPRAWSTRTALRRGKKMFDHMNDQVIKETGVGNIKPKYHDFKVLLDQEMGTTNTLVAQDAAGNDLLGGDWDYSRFISEDVDWSNLGTNANRDADEFHAMIVGNAHVGAVGNWTKIGLIHSWAGSRPQADDEPDTISSNITTDPLVNLFDEADTDDEILGRLRGDNNETPYEKASPPGAERPYSSTTPGVNLTRVAMGATQTGAGQISALSGFKALCGLIQVHVTQASPGQAEILLDIVPKGDKI